MYGWDWDACLNSQRICIRRRLNSYAEEGLAVHVARPRVAIFSRRRWELGDGVHQPEPLPLAQHDDPLRVAGGEGGVPIGMLVVVQQPEHGAVVPASGKNTLLKG